MMDILAIGIVAITVVIAALVLRYNSCRHDYRVISRIETPSVIDELRRAGVYEFSGLRPSACVRRTSVIVQCSKCGKLHTITR